MTADATAAAVSRPEAARPAITRAGRVVATGAALGLVGQLLFFDVGIGINAPITVLLALSAGWLSRRPGVGPRVSDAWLGPAAVALAAFAAVRADASIVALDLLGATTLTGMALVSFTGRDVLRSRLRTIVHLAAEGFGWVVAGVTLAVSQARRGLPADLLDAERLRPAIPLLRGLLLSILPVVVFVSLFVSADAVFDELLRDLFTVELDVGDLPGRLVLAAVLAWIATGALAMTAASPVPTERAASGPGWRLGTTEAMTVLVAVVVVFAVFVGLQAAYLFGGLDTLSVTGLTYSGYARRGFFELVAVAILAGGLVIALDRLVRRRTVALVGTAIALVALSGVVLTSAAVRMQLYQAAYGWTELRLYVVATIVLLAVLLVVLATFLALDRVRWIGHAVFVAGLIVGLALNAIGPVRFIAEQNVARALDPSLVPEHGRTGLDASYLGSLDTDAVPILVEALPNLAPSVAAEVRGELAWRLRMLRSDPVAWQDWNAGRAAALDALRAAERSGGLRDP